MESSGRALLIGIDAYESAPPLRGSANDVRLMADVLVRAAGFKPANIDALTDQAATRAEILRRLDALVDGSAPNDTLVLHFSGWGARVGRGEQSRRVVLPWRSPRPDGERPLADERLENVLIPHDGRPHDRESLIAHAELRERLERVRGKAIIVFDAPFAGGLLRGVDRERVGYLGATADDEVSYGITTPDGGFQGAVTYAFAQALLKTPGATLDQLFREVARDLASRRLRQHPSLEGNGAVHLDAPAEAAAAGVHVVSREGETVTLDAGGVACVTARSQWSIHAAGSAEPGSERKVGIVDIIDVTPTSATARIAYELERGAIAPGALAREELHHYGDMRLRVKLAESPMNAMLRELLEAAESLRLVGPDDRADVTVRVVGEGESVSLDGERDRTFQQPTWVVEDGHERVALHPRPAVKRAAYELRNDLTKLARYSNVAGLKNPNRHRALAHKVETHLEREAEGGWVEAEPDRERGICVFTEGEHFRLRITNRYDAPLHVNVLDLGLTMGIAPMRFPSPIEPEHTAELVSALYVPDDFWRAVGVETIKVFATTYPCDMEALLFQVGGRDVGSWRSDGSSTELWQLMDMALSGRGSPESRPVQLPADQEWTTVQHVFELRRKGR